MTWAAKIVNDILIIKFWWMLFWHISRSLLGRWGCGRLPRTDRERSVSCVRTAGSPRSRAGWSGLLVRTWGRPIQSRPLLPSQRFLIHSSSQWLWRSADQKLLTWEDGVQIYCRTILTNKPVNGYLVSLYFKYWYWAGLLISSSCWPWLRYINKCQTRSCNSLLVQISFVQLVCDIETYLGVLSKWIPEVKLLKCFASD